MKKDASAHENIEQAASVEGSGTLGEEAEDSTWISVNTNDIVTRSHPRSVIDRSSKN